MLGHGADINCRHERGLPILTFAAILGHEERVRFLFDQDAHFDIQDFRTWLHQTALAPVSGWSTGVVWAFLQRLTDICLVGENECRLLNLAAKYADCEIVQLCLAKDVDVNWKHPCGSTSLTKALLWYGSRYSDYFSNDLWYSFATDGKHKLTGKADRRAVALSLLDHGANPILGGEDLWLSAYYSWTGIRKLDDGSRRPLLVCAASRGFEWAAQELLDRGVDCNARATIIRKPERSWSPDRLASRPERASTEQVPKSFTEGGSALLYAARGGHVATSRLLLAYGADTILVDGQGKMALESTVENGYQQVEQVLLEHDEAMDGS